MAASATGAALSEDTARGVLVKAAVKTATQPKRKSSRLARRT